MTAVTMGSPEVARAERDARIRRDFAKLRQFGMSQLSAAIIVGLRYGIDESRVRQIARAVAPVSA